MLRSAQHKVTVKWQPCHISYCFYGKNGLEIEVDGGVDQGNASLICNEGATVLVAGNSVFGKPDPEVALKELKRIG